MSLILNIDSPPTENGHQPVAFADEKTVHISGVYIGMEDFCELVKYVMTNGDLVGLDPRLMLREQFRRLETVPGWNEGGKRLIFLDS